MACIDEATAVTARQLLSTFVARCISITRGAKVEKELLAPAAILLDPARHGGAPARPRAHLELRPTLPARARGTRHPLKSPRLAKVALFILAAS